MYPWLAFGHITPFLHLANKLARKGHRVSFLIPTKTRSKIQHLNRFPQLITFVPVTVPHVDGLPPGAETTADVAAPLVPLIATAVDRTEPAVEILLRDLRPDVVFYDFAYWLPKLSRSVGFKTVFFSTASPVVVAFMIGYTSAAPERLLEPPPGFPDSSIKLRRHELSYFVEADSQDFGGNMKLPERVGISMRACDAYASKGCREIDGPFIDFTEKLLDRKIWLAGPLSPEPASASGLDPKWDGFLSRFERGSAVYLCLGSELRMSRGQFEELVAGLELCGRPFLAAVKGFEDRVGERGAVHGGWIQQQQILAHPSVGCFVTHCGAGSLMEAMVNPCQLVMIPHEGDHFFQAKMIGNTLKAGIEVERDEENGWFCRGSLSKAIHTVMCDEQSNELGREIRVNRAKLQKLLQDKDLEDGYIDDFSDKLRNLLIC